MTREAKIGMLTGLGVIVLIGVLLSEYLGGGSAGMGGSRAMSPTGRMAELPLGAAYRNQVTEATGVPAIASEGGSNSSQTPSTPTMAPVAAGSPSMPEPMKASEQVASANIPAMNQPVAAIPAGRMQTEQPMMGNVPTLQIPENAGQQTAYVPSTSGQGGSRQASGSADASTVAMTAYVIQPGDTLPKIARKFYKSSAMEDQQRIVAANPTLLKNEKSMLFSGRKLMIPAVATVEQPVASAKVAPVTPRKATVVIHPPGAAAAASSAKGTDAGSTKAEPAKHDTVKTYVVQSGDSLEKIARKFSSSNVAENVKKLKALNGIKDDKSLQVEAKLKISLAD